MLALWLQFHITDKGIPKTSISPSSKLSLYTEGRNGMHSPVGVIVSQMKGSIPTIPKREHHRIDCSSTPAYPDEYFLNTVDRFVVGLSVGE